MDVCGYGAVSINCFNLTSNYSPCNSCHPWQSQIILNDTTGNPFEDTLVPEISRTHFSSSQVCTRCTECAQGSLQLQPASSFCHNSVQFRTHRPRRWCTFNRKESAVSALSIPDCALGSGGRLTPKVGAVQRAWAWSLCSVCCKGSMEVGEFGLSPVGERVTSALGCSCWLGGGWRVFLC